MIFDKQNTAGSDHTPRTFFSLFYEDAMIPQKAGCPPNLGAFSDRLKTFGNPDFGPEKTGLPSCFRAGSPGTSPHYFKQVSGQGTPTGSARGGAILGKRRRRRHAFLCADDCISFVLGLRVHLDQPSAAPLNLLRAISLLPQTPASSPALMWSHASSPLRKAHQNSVCSQSSARLRSAGLSRTWFAVDVGVRELGRQVLQRTKQWSTRYVDSSICGSVDIFGRYV